MTRRERQLLEWIRENPCISQQELADKAGITRSSAAVHISNLMRKGYIAGRGYLLREAPYIAVVGGVNMDIGAVSEMGDVVWFSRKSSSSCPYISCIMGRTVSDRCAALAASL